MRFVTLDFEHRDRLALLDGDNLLMLEPGDGWPDSLLALIDAGPQLLARLANSLPTLRPRAPRVPLAEATLRAPIPRPRKNVMCIGLNYRAHAEEGARARGLSPALPGYPVVFTKNVTSINAPDSPIPSHPGLTAELDWEVELGVVIGTGGRAIAREHALEHVFGYTVINDVSARDLQMRHRQYFLGKSLDGACPIGPAVVTRDEIPDPQNLRLTCRVNGVLKQDGNTRDMLFDVATLISLLSQGMLLEPGDIIATGTPSGVGFARNPPEYLRAGDVVECEVEGIGRLRNPVQ